MILYTKDAKFLGASTELFNSLGFSDAQEFYSLHEDIADLFVKKTGYIHKYKDFSWIDYVLHSGSPNKKVLLKIQNGKTIEANFSVKLIECNNMLKKSGLAYTVQLHFQKDNENNIKTIKQNKTDNNKNTNLEYLDLIDFESENEEKNSKQAEVIQCDNPIETKNTKVELNLSESKTHNKLDEISQLENTHEETETISIKKLKNLNFDLEKKENIYKVKNDTILLKYEIENLSQELSLDANVIEQFIYNFSNTLKQDVPKVEKYFHSGSIDEANKMIQNWIKVSNNLLLKDFILFFSDFMSVILTQDKIQFENKLNQLKMFLKNN